MTSADRRTLAAEAIMSTMGWEDDRNDPGSPGVPPAACWSLANDVADAVLAATGRLPEDLRGDGPCGDCGTLDNIIWFTESVFWNAVMRPPGYESEPLLCIPCFVVRADAAGYFPTGWRLIPDWHWETKDERGRRRADATPAADGQDGHGAGDTA